MSVTTTIDAERLKQLEALYAITKEIGALPVNDKIRDTLIALADFDKPADRGMEVAERLVTWDGERNCLWFHELNGRAGQVITEEFSSALKLKWVRNFIADAINAERFDAAKEHHKKVMQALLERGFITDDLTEQAIAALAPKEKP